MGTSLKDKTVVVTGGTRGIGKQTASGLARLGATVAIVGRDERRGAAAAADIRAAPARIVNLTSGVVHHAHPELDALQSEGSYHPLASYGLAKVLNLAWTLELAGRLQGTGVSVFAVDPGIADTGTHRDYPRPAPVRTVMRLAWLVLRRRLSVERAADAVIRAATASDLADRNGLVLDKNGRPIDPPALVRRDELRRAAGEVTRGLVGLDGLGAEAAKGA